MYPGGHHRHATHRVPSGQEGRQRPGFGGKSMTFLLARGIFGHCVKYQQGLCLFTLKACILWG
jgi:hypothetical protein